MTLRDRHLVRATLLICGVLVLASMGAQCSPGNGVSVTIDDEAIGISAVAVEGGIEITNTGRSQ